MSENKSLLLEIAEVIDRRLSQRKARADESTPRPSRLGRFLRWMVPNGGTLLLILILILTQRIWARPLMAGVDAPGPSATTINYQGRLADPAGNPLDGNYSMVFSLWDAASGGAMVWGPETHDAVPVSNGLFSVGLGSRTSGGIPTTVWDGDRYLEITVGGETLSPRELLRSVPIAGMALTVPDGAIGTAKLEDGAVTQAKAPSLVASAPTNTEVRYGRATAYAASQTDILSVDVSFDPPFSSEPHLFLTPVWNYTNKVIAISGTPCDPSMCRIYLILLSGGYWNPGQFQQVDWLAIKYH